MTRRVVVTGVGAATSLGPTAASTWNNLLHRSNRPESTRAQNAFSLSESVVSEALVQSGVDSSKAACTFSASKPLFDGMLWQGPHAVNDFVHDRFRLGGERRNVVAACATGAYSIAMAASWIEHGICEVAVAGSVESAPHPLMEAGFRKMGVVSEEEVMRPFDRRRSGFVFGEGAGAVVLESEPYALRRGARPLARLTGWAMGADAHGPVSFNSKGARIAGVMSKTLAKARLAASSIQHINAHGTATALNDPLETQAIHTAFGPHAPELAVSATKSSTGHLLGAAGSVEFILTLLALRDQQVPPTRHWGESDPACDLDYVPGDKARAWPMIHAMSVSFGFGGPIAALVVSRW